MPIIQFEGPKLTKEQKIELAGKFTKAAKEVLNQIPEEAFIVLLKENEAENIATGGKLLSEKK